MTHLVSAILIYFAAFAISLPSQTKPNETRINLKSLGSSRNVVFREITQVKQLPPSVLRLFPEGIANPGEPFNVTDVMREGLPFDRLILAATSEEYCLVHYERGGRGHTYRIVLFKLGSKATAAGSAYSSKLSNLAELKATVEAGRSTPAPNN